VALRCPLRARGGQRSGLLVHVDVSVRLGDVRELVRVSDGRSLGEAQTRRNMRDHAVLADGHVLGVRAGADTEDAITGLELRDAHSG
jgi:hypothetical protein